MTREIDRSQLERRRRGPRPLVVIAAVAALAPLGACVALPGPVPDEAGIPLEPADPGGQPPAPPPTVPDVSGCAQTSTVSMNITGKVLAPTGIPFHGHVVLRDRVISPGSILAEASANDAGFFLLGVRGAVLSNDCVESYVVEVDSVSSGGDTLLGELDVTDVVAAGGPTVTDVDITATPVLLALAP